MNRRNKLASPNRWAFHQFTPFHEKEHARRDSILAQKDTIPLSCLPMQDSCELCIVLFNCEEPRLRAALVHAELQRTLLHFDHVCRCAALTGAIGYLDLDRVCSRRQVDCGAVHITGDQGHACESPVVDRIDAVLHR